MIRFVHCFCNDCPQLPLAQIGCRKVAGRKCESVGDYVGVRQQENRAICLFTACSVVTSAVEAPGTVPEIIRPGASQPLTFAVPPLRRRKAGARVERSRWRPPAEREAAARPPAVRDA